MNRKLIVSIGVSLLALAVLLMALPSPLPSADAKSLAVQPLSVPYTQTFDTLANSGTNITWTNDSTLPGWYSSRTAYSTNTGSSTTGAQYSYGVSTASTERALGSLASDTTGSIYYGVRFHNDTGVNVNGIVITYTGEQWRVVSNTQASTQSLAFAYRIGAIVTDVVSGTWTNVNALNFVSSVTSTTSSPLDGNAAANRRTISGTINFTLPPDQEIMFRWQDINDDGSDYGLAIDDLSIVGLLTEANLAINKSGPDSALPGASITYTIGLSNTGTFTATATRITDTLPAGVAFVTYTAALSTTFSQPTPDTLIWGLGDVGAGATDLKIDVQAVISPGVSNGTLLTNSVQATTAARETITADNTAQATTFIGAPDVAVVKTGPTSVNAGDALTFTLTYSNNGNLPAIGVALVDQLPSAMSYVTDSLGTGVRLGDTITWTIDHLAPGASGSLMLTATALTLGSWTNVAVIRGVPVDADLFNNTSICTTTILSGDPFVIKTGPAIAFDGELITYTIVYGNHGNATADVTLTDTLPISFTTADIADDSGFLTYIDGGNTRSWTATLAAGDRFAFTLALTVPAEIATNARITNTIEIATSSLGNNSIDDVSSASSTVYQIVPISEARAGSIGQLFAVEGRVTYMPGTYNTTGWALQDSSGGIAVAYTPVPSITLGDRVRLVATRGNNHGEEQLTAPVPYSQILGSGPEVTPLPFTTGQIASGNTQGWLSVITGTISGLDACSSDYQFNVDDDSGAAVVFVDGTTAVDVCTLGAVNGGPISVIGYSTELTNTMPPTITYEVKPRRPADVKLLYQTTFVYHDVEDVVHTGEDVQLRGDFTNWDSNPITMTHDPGYTVFTTTVVLPTSAVQNYRYFASTAGANGYTWLNNYADRVVAPTAHVTVKDDYRLVQPNAADLLGLAFMIVDHGTATPAVSATLFITGVTDFDDAAARGLEAEVGYGTNADPSTWIWSPLTILTKSAGSDVYSGSFTPTLTGVYSYAVRFNANAGTGNPMSDAWTYTDLDGLPFSLNKTGVLTVTAPQLAIDKAVATTHVLAELGEVVTYTLTLSNTGSGTATGMLIIDVLPSALNFGGFMQQNGAMYSGGAITWNGSPNASASVTIVFTATVKDDRFLYGTDVLNTVQFTSSNGGNGSAYIAFSVVKRYFTYLPLIKR
jgi:uncharacterized repeat protein (TIGR01451 family)